MEDQNINTKLQEGQPQNGSGQYAQVIQNFKNILVNIKTIILIFRTRAPCLDYSPLYPSSRPHWLMGFSSPQRVAKMTKRLEKMIMDEAGITSIKP